MMIKKVVIFGALCAITVCSSLKISLADTVKLSGDDGGNGQERALQKPIDELTLQGALELVQKYNPDLAAFDWEVRSKEGAVSQAGMLPNPELSLEVSNFGGEDDLSGFDGAETSVGLSQLIELGGKRAKRLHTASLEKKMAQSDVERKRHEILAETTKAFVDVIAAQKRLEQAREMAVLSDSVFRSVSERVKAGKVSPVEEVRSSVERTSSKLVETRAEQELEAARKFLATLWSGGYPHFERATGDLEAVDKLPSFKHLETHIRQNPETARWETVQKQRSAEYELAESMAIPDVTAGFGVRRFQETGNHAYFLSLDMPLPLFDRNRGGRAEALAQMRKSRFEKEAARMQIRSEVESVFLQLSGAHSEVKVLKTEGLPAAQSAFESVSTGYREGKFSLLDVLDAQRTLFDVKGQYQATLVSYHKAKADLEYLIGRPLSSIYTDESKIIQ